jgi:hypothetical protein
VQRFGNLANEVEIALAVSVPDLKGYGDAVLTGRERIPAAPAPIAKLVAPRPQPTETIYFLKPAKWTDDAGQLHLIQKTNDATLPVAQARLAIAKSYAVERTDPQRKQTLGAWSGRPLRREDCVALDVASETSNIMASTPQFEQMDRGGPLVGILPNRQPVAATRSEPIKK